EREPLNMEIKLLPKIVQNPLSDFSGEKFLGVSADCVKRRNHQHSPRRKLKRGYFVGPGRRCDELAQRPRRGLGAQNVIENDLQGPRLEQVCDTCADGGN